MSLTPALPVFPPATTSLPPDATGDMTDPVSALDKQDRKRLKKLRKRAVNVIAESERSGLLTQLEWLEFQKLSAMGDDDSATLVGPLVTHRKRKESNKVEGSHHRDLVAWFMDQIQHRDSLTQTKKRKKKEEGDSLEKPNIPSWASIHNSAAIDALLVLEINHKSTEQQSKLGKCQSAVDVAVEKSRGRRALHLPTKWFQGHIPKSMSDGLLYFASNSERRNPSKSEQENKPSMESLMKSLEEMILPLQQWKDERYPERIQNESCLDVTSSLTNLPLLTGAIPLDVTSVPLDDAKEFVAKCGFRVEHQNQDDAQLYISTRSDDTAEASSSDTRIFGMDCEMVLTSMGSELARITLVELVSFDDGHLTTTTVLDTLVKPENPVKDYLTRHSGITAELLEPISTRLVQVQAALFLFLRPNDILVGHSLENDLMATHFIHPRIIDTALAFRPRNKRTKFSLRHMSAYLLKKTIQQGSHCSQEDAEATLELAIRKAWLGDAFGLPNTDERRSIFEKWNGDSQTKTVCIGPPGWLQAHVTNHANGVHALGYETVAECKKAILAWTKGPRKAHLTWCRLNISDDVGNNVDDLQQFLVRPSIQTEQRSGMQLISSFLSHMQVELLIELPFSTTILIAFQEGLEKAREGLSTRRACQDPRSSVGWSADKEAAWRPVLETSRLGVASWIGASNVLRADNDAPGES